MHRFFLNAENFQKEQVDFPENIAHQIQHVLRLKAGDQVEVLDNSGYAYNVILQFSEIHNQLLGKINHQYQVTSEPSVKIDLYFGLSTREKVEWILQKGTEIGVAAFCPYISSRTQVQSTIIKDNKRRRWEQIIREAAEQSGRGRLPIFHECERLQTFFDHGRMDDQMRIIAFECAEPVPKMILSLLEDFLGKSIGLFVGPEGGFSDDEIQSAVSAGCNIVSLGPRILRMETAAVVLPALVLHELGE